MSAENDKAVHEISVNMRRHMDINGVREVVSFDESGVTLKTVCGELCIEGRDVKVGVLDVERGIVSLDGKIDALFYSEGEENKKRGVFGKLLK